VWGGGGREGNRDDGCRFRCGFLGAGWAWPRGQSLRLYHGRGAHADRCVGMRVGGRVDGRIFGGFLGVGWAEPETVTMEGHPMLTGVRGRWG
jgi:hypothetical protein